MKNLIKAFILSMIFVNGAIHASDRPVEVGLYASIVGADGEPSNDIMGIGIFSIIPLQDNWFVDVEYILSSEADFERPWKTVGLSQSSSVDTIDAVYTSEILMVHFGQTANFSANADWYWSAGIGINNVDVDNVSGPLQGGGNFSLVTDVDTETVIGLKVGLVHSLSQNWAMNYSFRIDQHLADWTVTDTVSNTTGTVSDYMTFGLNIGVSKSF